LDEIRSVLQQTVAGGAGKLCNVLSLTDASTKLLRFVSDDVWGSKHHHHHHHHANIIRNKTQQGGRGADGVDAMT
jgi:hypothetical protein